MTETKTSDAALDNWNSIYSQKTSVRPPFDNWLNNYISELKNTSGMPVADLGCGGGGNTIFLDSLHLKVISSDYSIEALKKTKHFLPQSRTVLFDFREGMPFKSGCTGIAIADLSLHYFSWKMTEKITADISDMLCKGGLLLCRLNSVNDSMFGAGKGRLTEHNYYEQDGIFKRFFDRADIYNLFSKWDILSCREYESDRYGSPKILWETAVSKSVN